MTADDRARVGAAFSSPHSIVGGWRSPAQLLGHQALAASTSVHDAAAASSVGWRGAPIEGPTHLSLLDPLAVAAWGADWFAHARVSVHYVAPVYEGESTQATLVTEGVEASGRWSVVNQAGETVLDGTASLGLSVTPTACEVRMARHRDPVTPVLLSKVTVGRASPTTRATLTFDTPLGPMYPFTLRAKLDAITEPSPWYEGTDNPWGRPVIPVEMLSPLLHFSHIDDDFGIDDGVIGIFMDQEIQVHDGPLFVGEDYLVDRRVVAMGVGRRTESYWLAAEARSEDGRLRASMLLHVGFFTASAGPGA